MHDSNHLIERILSSLENQICGTILNIKSSVFGQTMVKFLAAESAVRVAFTETLKTINVETFVIICS